MKRQTTIRTYFDTAEISQHEAAVTVKPNVFWLKVTMQEFVLSKICQSPNNLDDYETRMFRSHHDWCEFHVVPGLYNGLRPRNSTTQKKFFFGKCKLQTGPGKLRVQDQNFVTPDSNHPPRQAP